MIYLKFLRISRNLRQGDLARKAGLDQTCVSRLESGRMNPTPREAARLSKALGVPSDRLFAHVPDPLRVPGDDAAYAE